MIGVTPGDKVFRSPHRLIERGLRAVKKGFIRISTPALRHCVVASAGFLLALSFLWGATATEDGQKHQEPSSAAAQEFAEARDLLTQGLLEKALAAVREGLSLSPKSVEGYNLLGIINGQQGNHTQAVAAFQEALKLAPRSTTTHNNLGMSYSIQRKIDLAEHEFHTTLLLDPQNRDANYNLGLISLARGDSKQAITFLSRVRPPDFPSMLSLTEAYFRSGQSAKALESAKLFRVRQRRM